MKAAIFDLDGTLADTALDLMLAGNATYGDMGIEYRMEKDRDLGIASKGGKSTIRHGLNEAFGIVDEDRVKALYLHFLKNYEKVIDSNSVLYNGMREVLEEILELDVLLGVCTNKPKKQAQMLLNILNISNYFTAIVGPDSFGIAKPNPQPLNNIIKMIGAKPESSVLIGDTNTDFLTSAAAEVPFILATYGHGVQYQGLNESCTPYLANCPKEIPRLISEILKKC